VADVNTLITIGASIATGVIVGVWLTATAATTAMGHLRQRMQRKIGYWQNRAMHAEDTEWRPLW
jgi:hypothetical protein